MKKFILSLSIAAGLVSTSSYADQHDLNAIQIKANSTESIKLSPIKEQFPCVISCDIFNSRDAKASIKVRQRYNDFGVATLNGDPLNKINGRETVRGQLKLGRNVLVMTGLNDNSGWFMKDYLIFESNSQNTLEILCSVEAMHNMLP